MKIIDLLNKIARGEEPPEKIKYSEKRIYEYEGLSNNYYCKEFDDYLLDDCDLCILNDEVEIIEEDKKIEKLNDYFRGEKWFNEIGQQRLDDNFDKFAEKINELIDEVNKTKKGDKKNV